MGSIVKLFGPTNGSQGLDTDIGLFYMNNFIRMNL